MPSPTRHEPLSSAAVLTGFRESGDGPWDRLGPDISIRTRPISSPSDVRSRFARRTTGAPTAERRMLGTRGFRPPSCCAERDNRDTRCQSRCAASHTAAHWRPSCTGDKRHPEGSWTTISAPRTPAKRRTQPACTRPWHQHAPRWSGHSATGYRGVRVGQVWPHLIAGRRPNGRSRSPATRARPARPGQAGTAARPRRVRSLRLPSRRRASMQRPAVHLRTGRRAPRPAPQPIVAGPVAAMVSRPGGPLRELPPRACA